MKHFGRLKVPLLPACVVIVLLVAVALPHAQESDAPAVNYISADAVYLNVGRYAGLRIGATVEVVRDGQTIAVLEVIHVSSHSSSCRVVEQTDPPRVGDTVVFEPAAPEPAIEPPPAAARTAAAVAPDKNIVSGYVSLETAWQKDLTGSDITSVQPAVAARVVVRNVGGTGLVFRFRDRLRYYYRDQPPGALIAKDEWTHRLTELALISDRPDVTVQWGVGRLIAPYMVGIGHIDGGYAAYRINRYFRAGLAGGLEPDPIDLGVDAQRQQIGAFVAFDYESPRSWRFSSSAALAGSWASGDVNRDFVYFQNAFSLIRKFSLFQSAEIDINRDWRRDAAGESATLTNFYFAANAEVSRYALVDLTYDSRKNVRVYDTIAVPDSLWDDGLYDGFGGGLSLLLPRSVTLGGRGGIRYREDDRTSRYYSIFARVSRLPWRGHALSLRYAYAQTRFTTGYRPVATYRFPVGRTLRLNVDAGGYIYDRGTTDTSSFYGQVGAYYPFGRYFASGSYRQYFGGNLESILMFAEVGLNL